MKNNLRRVLSCVLAGILLVFSCACSKKPGSDPTDTGNSTTDNRTYYNNQTDPLVFSTQDVDGVFNPFFSTSATDSTVVGMTQISMLSNDKNGNVTYGDGEAVVTKDLQIIPPPEGSKAGSTDYRTTYYFVLKNNIRFSNGSYLTIKDVLFNLYVYLDPAYTGSATMYSTDIVGLAAYRTQSGDENEQDAFKQQFMQKAATRINSLISASNAILKEHASEDLTSDSFRTYLQAYASTRGEAYANIVKDYDEALVEFKKELQTDFSNFKDSYQDQKFYDENGVLCSEATFTTDVEMFLYNEGYISWSKKDKALVYATGTPEYTKNMTEEEAIAFVYNANIPENIATVIQYWATATTLRETIANDAMEQYFQTATKAYTNISGIRFANRTEPVTVNGVTYGVPEYNADGSVIGNEVLSITINGVDPKAIWNFAFAVAPMYYYSDEAHIAAFDYESHFGVEYASQSFMTNVVNSSDKIGVPVGAGPYVASKASGGTDHVSATDFRNGGVIYFEANPYYVMGEPLIKKVRFQVISATQMLSALYRGEIDYVEPNAKPETISELNSKASDGIANKSIQTAGYGYIGINAGKVPDIEVRQAIMHCINTQECVDYYQTTATAIYRSMSMSSWAYPEGCTPYYPYIGGPVPENLEVVNPAYKDYVIQLGKKAGDTFTEDEQLAFINALVQRAGYTVNGNGVYQNGNQVLKYTFTVAGEETDHPAWQAMNHAAELLNKCNFEITVSTDANALKKLSTGALTVWAAAWGSTIDPDMYQVYHKDSSATSVLNWGYKQILQNVGGKYDYELALVEQLSELIDRARETTDQDTRASIYSEALDLVMQLAIELPTYQRDDLFAYNALKIDSATLTPDSELSSFKGLTSDIHEISLVVRNEEQ